MSPSPPTPSVPSGQPWICTGCGARLPIRVEHVGRKCRCDRCGLVFLVKATPSATTVDNQRASTGTTPHTTRTYPPGSQRVRGATPHRGKRPSQTVDLWNTDELWGVDEAPLPSELVARQPELIPVPCQLCQTLMYATGEQIGARLVCPDCGRKTVVRPPPLKPVRAPKPVVEGYELDEASAPGPRPTAVPTIVRRELEKEQHEKEGQKSEKEVGVDIPDPISTHTGSRPKLPRNPLLQGVGLMLRCGPVAVRWFVLSITLIPIGWFASWVTMPMATEFHAIAAVCFLTVATILGMLWSMGAAAIWIAILTESSDGNDRLYHPPDIHFYDWMGALLYIVFASAISAIPVSFLGSAIPGMSLWLRIGTIVAGWLFGFPLVLLSMLELGTPLAIVSPRIYASLLRSPGPWLLFYLETALLVAGCVGAIYGLLQISPRLILAVGPALMAMAFVYFRLLGRLAWWLSEKEGRRQ